MKVTQADLNNIVGIINRKAGTPAEPYAKDKNGNFQPQANCYHLAGAYGGWKLEQMCETGSGVKDVTFGYVPKRELYYQLRAFLAGLEA